MVKRFGFPAAILSTAMVATLVPAGALAAPPASLLCTDTKTVDCVRDEIFIIDGAAPDFSGEPIAFPCSKDPEGSTAAAADPTCRMFREFGAPISRALKLSRDAGATDLYWDTIVLFGADFTTGADPELVRPPNFRRQSGANLVRGIGLSGVTKPDPAFPFIGIISAGSTSSFGVFIAPDEPPPAGVPAWPEPDPAGVEGFETTHLNCRGSASCFSFNGYQVLAQAVGQVHGPYLTLNPAAPATSEVRPGDQPKVRGGDGVYSDTSGGTRVWNTFFDLDGSLLTGNNWRNNGNGEVEIAFASPHWAASAPFRGEQLYRFHPYDLYLMGLVPPETLQPIPDYSMLKGFEGTIVNPITKRPVEIRPNLGLFVGVPIKLKDFDKESNNPITDEKDRRLRPEEIFADNGLRNPAFADAPHYHRQLWVVVTNPAAPEKTKEQIDFMLRWRRAWNQYYYMLTSYHGRMVTTFDGKEDDSAYWEFAQAVDEQQTFVPVGDLQAAFPGPLPRPGSDIIDSFVRVATPGPAGGLKMTPHKNQLPLRIKGQQGPGATNAVVVRLRIPPGAITNDVGQPVPASARIELDTGISIRLPSQPGSFLVADGEWHDYSADLRQVPGFAEKDHTGFTFFPADARVAAMDVDFIQWKWVDPMEHGDTDLDCTGTVQPDGFINTADNCPKHFNPDQRDANGDDIGDACEDFDLDSVVNTCDNCPTLTNSRQRDRNGNNMGDECDPSQGAGCFLQPEASVAGPERPGVFMVLVVGVLLGLGIAIRRRRR